MPLRTLFVDFNSYFASVEQQLRPDTITGSIIGVGSVQKLSAVRWGVAGSIVWAWLLTIPCSAFISAVAWYLGMQYLK